jgi:PAS domain S-box-containing protein
MSLTDREKEQLKAMIDAGEPMPARYRAVLFAEPHEAEPISPGKTAEATDALRESERRLQLVVEAAPNAMVMVDRAGKIVMVNTEAERLFGYSRAELAGQPVEMLPPGRFRGHHPGLRATFFADPRPRPMGVGRDLYGLKKDGSEFPVEIGLNPIETDGGTMVLSAIVDITERKTAELALRESERGYSMLVDGVTDYAIFMLDPNGIVTNWNRGAERIKGYRAEEIVGQHFSRFYTEEDRAANMPRHALEIAARDGRHEAESLRVRKDGSRYWANVVIDAIKDDNGQLIGFAKITRDITERLEAERAREEARIAQSRSQQMEAIRLVIDTIPALVWSALPDGSVDFVSRRWLEFTGFSAEQALGWGYTAAIHPEDMERWRAQRPARVATGAAFEDETRFRRADGEYRQFLTRLTPLHDEAGKIVKWYGTATDIEDRKRVEALQAELALANRVMLMGELTASIAHEVNQPIAATVANASAALRWLAAQPPDMEEARQALKRIVRDGNRASEIVSRIRALVRKAPPRRDRLDINEAVLEVIAMTHSELQRKNIKLQTRLASDLPFIWANRVQLQQVILNLIVNAIEAMSEVGDGPRELTVSSSGSNSNDVLVEVRDSGPGFDPAGLDRLFHSFYTTKAEGMGMGLAISRSIVEAHGGRLWAMPDEPHGAVFRLTLPVGDESSPHSIASPS